MSTPRNPWSDPAAPPHRRLAWWREFAPVIHASFELGLSGSGWACSLNWGAAIGVAGLSARGASAEGAVEHALQAFNDLMLEPTRDPEPAAADLP